MFCIIGGQTARNLSHEITIHVESPLALLGAPTLLLRPGSRGEIRTNRPAEELRYRIIGTSLGETAEDATSAITVDTSSAQGTLEHALVVASAEAMAGLTVYLAIECERGDTVQAVVVTVEVRMLHAVHWRYPAGSTNVLALGSSLTLAVDMSDKIGRSFAPLVVREAALYYETSHSNVELATSKEDGDNPGTRVTFTGMSVGACVARVMVHGAHLPSNTPRCASELGTKTAGAVSKPLASDYIQLSVIDVLALPLLHVGAQATYALAPGTSEIFPPLADAVSYKWRSAQRHVVDLIDDTSGDARAGVTHGAATVELEALDKLLDAVWATRTEAFVSQITEVTIGDDSTVLSDASGHDDLVPIQFSGLDIDGASQALSNFGSSVDQRIIYTCSSPDEEFVSAATAVHPAEGSAKPFQCQMTYNSETKKQFPSTLRVSVTATDHDSSYSITETKSFEFVGAFDLRPSESVNLWPNRANITVEVLRARRPIRAIVEDEAASWGLFATALDGGGFMVGVGPAAWRAEFNAAPHTWESTIVFECAEIDQTQTLKVHFAQASYERPVDTMTVGQEIDANLPELPGGLATRGFIVQPELPAGLVIDADTGSIQGVPTTATDDSGVPQRFTVCVLPSHLHSHRV